MLVTVSSASRGDTLIEALFAVTVFSLVAVGALSIMNSGVATGQRALEISLVREQMDAQAETLRYIHDSYVAAYPNPVSEQPSGEWVGIISKAVVQASGFGSTCTKNSITIPANAFIVNPITAKLDKNAGTLSSIVQTYSQIRIRTAPTESISAEGIWVEAVKLNPANKYVDFHIRACWDSLGLSAPMTLGTIVRLYEP